MAKGRTTQPIRVKVHEQWMQHPAVQNLRSQGHQIIAVAGDDCDLILHPAAHGWHEVLFVEAHRKDGTPYRPFLEAAVKAGRARRKAK